MLINETSRPTRHPARRAVPAARSHRSGVARPRFGNPTFRRSSEGTRRLPGHRRAFAQPGANAARRASPDAAIRNAATAPVTIPPEPVPPPHAQPQHFITLPAFAGEVPPSIEWHNGAQGTGALARIAQTLLDAGVLQDGDWQGNLSDTLHAGLVRWAHEECGAAKLAHITLNLTFCDDADDDADFSAVRWHERFGGRKDQPIGALLMTTAPYPYDAHEVIVGATISKIEAFGRGAGFAILGLIDVVCLMTMPIATPRWAYGAAGCYGSFHVTSEEWRERRWDHGYSDDENEADENDVTGLVTEDSFFRAIPLDAVREVEDGPEGPGIEMESVWNARQRRRVQRALKNVQAVIALDKPPRDGFPFVPSPREQLRDVLEQALELDGLFKAARAQFPSDDLALTLNHNLLSFNHADWPVAVLRWSKTDPIPRLLDDHHESIGEGGGVSYLEDEESGEGEPVVFTRGWQLAQAEGVGALQTAVGALGMTLRLMVALDKLLSLLDSREDVPPHPFRRPPKKRDKPAKQSQALVDVLQLNEAEEFVTQL